MKKSFLLPIIFLVFISCSKKENVQSVDTTKPLIKIIAPSNNELFAIGNDICFKASVSDESPVRNIAVKFFRNGAQVPGAGFTETPMLKNILIDKKILVTNAIEGNVSLQLEATDINGNCQKVSVELTSN
jgi:hypothetical protein